MIFSKEQLEDSLTYADSLINGVTFVGQMVLVIGERYDQSELKLKFNDAKIIHNKKDFPERVEVAQKIKLKNGKKRLLLFNDDNELFFEVEYSNCNDI